MRSEAKDITQKIWKGVKKVIAAGLVSGKTGLSFTAADLFLAGGETTGLLAKSCPEWFDRLLSPLNMFGLQDPNEQPGPFVAIAPKRTKPPFPGALWRGAVDGARTRDPRRDRPVL